MTELNNMVNTSHEQPESIIQDRKISGSTFISQLKPVTEKESFLPMLHGKATDAIAGMSGSKITENKLNNTGVIEAGEVKLILNQFTELSGTLGVSTHKLLSTAIASFTGTNHTGKAKDLRALRVFIPLKEYAKKCGYDIDPHLIENMTPVEQEKEIKRADNALKNARKKIKKDLVLLTSSSLYFEESVKGKQGDFTIANILGKGSISKGNIVIEFTLSMGEYLIQLPLTQYPIALLSIDERNNNAYILGLKMTEHYNMDNNHIMKTAQLLKVKTLLQPTTFPTIDKVNKNKNRWEDRIKEPFERALDALTQCGLLSDWRYSFSKGVEMTDEEATSFTTYEEWENTLVHFTLEDAPDHTARLEAREEEKKARQAKGKKKTTKKN